MPDSEEHTRLVKLLIDCITARHGTHPGLCIYSDRSECRRDEKPRPVEGCVPDVLAVTTPASFTIIGEAKTHIDLGTPRSHAQIRSFLRFLEYSASPLFILAVPVSTYAFAFSMVQNLKRQATADHVQTEIVTFATKVKT
jgi:hypothetical protein